MSTDRTSTPEPITVESVSADRPVMQRTGTHSPAQHSQRDQFEPWSDVKSPCAVVRGVPVFPITSDGIKNIAPAFARAQRKFDTAKRDTDNPGFKTADGKTNARYADLASVHDACMAALNAEDIGVTHFTVPIGDDVYLLTRATHASGEWYQSSFPLSTLDSVRQSIADAQKAPVAGLLGSGLDATGPSEGTVKKKRAPGVQALGSEITYLRRYCLSALVGVATEDDDDGNAAVAHTSSRAAAPAQQARRPIGGGL